MQPLPQIQSPGTSSGGTPSRADMQSIVLEALNRRASGQQYMPSATVPGAAPAVQPVETDIASVRKNTGQPLPPGMPQSQNAPVVNKEQKTGANFDDETRVAAKVLMEKLLKHI